MTQNVNPKKSRRKRRSKAEIAAEKEVKALQQAEETKMEAEGFEKVRNRNEKGHYVADDPSTPENEAWEWQKVEEPVAEAPASEPVPAPAPEPEPAVQAQKAKALTYNGETSLDQIACRFKRRRAKRRNGL